MTFEERVADKVAQMPAELKEVLDRQLAAGNEITGVEVGRGEFAGRVQIQVNYPFRAATEPLPAGVLYREARECDPMLFEFYTADDRWSLLTAKFKPMKLAPLPVPKNPGAEAMARVLAKQAAEANAPPRPPIAVTPPAPPITTAAKVSSADPVERFLSSMVMDFDKWHDGTGWDLDALEQVPPDKLPTIESALLARRPFDWRDIEALAQIDSPKARAAVLAAVDDPDAAVRRTARAYVPAEAVDPKRREQHLIQALKNSDLHGGLSQAIDEAAEFHPPAVIKLLIRGALRRPGPAAVHFAALLYFLHGKSEEPFDWDHRPFFLRFDGSAERPAHLAAFRELCATIGVDPAEHGLHG